MITTFLLNERSQKLKWLVSNLTNEHLANFIDWLEENGFRTKKYYDLLDVIKGVRETSLTNNGHPQGVSMLGNGVIVYGYNRFGILYNSGEVKIVRTPKLDYEIPF